MFSSIQKSIIIDISKKKIQNTLDFFRIYIKPEKSDQEINGKKYPNSYLISDFQEALYLFNQYSSVINRLTEIKYMRINYNPANKELFTVIQKSHLSQKFEKSQPIHSLLANIIEYDIKLLI